MKRLIILFMLVLIAHPPATFGQASVETDPAYLPIDNLLDLKTIQPTVNINLPHFLLKDALSALNATATNSAQPGGNDLAGLLKDIKLIRVVVIEAKKNNRAALDKGMKALRAELDKKWTPIMNVSDEGNVHVYAMSDAAGESTVGLAVLVHDDGDAVIGNIVGHIALDKVIKLASQKDPLKNLEALGIPASLFGGQSGGAGTSGLEEPTEPKITGTSALSADEVLKGALAARGGAEALQNIHSIHGKGHAHFKTPDNTCDAMAEYFAMRPARWRAVLPDIKTSAGQDLGSEDQGFDGHRGWDNEPGAAPKELTGRRLKRKKEDGQLFAFQDDPAVYTSIQCLGEASFDGKTCYALKMVNKSGHEETHYFDTNNFMLLGTYTTDQDDGPPEKDSYGDYREFGGFKIPMRIGFQSKESAGEVLFDSVELNSVEESSLQMPASGSN